MDILYQIRARQDSFSAGEGRIARLMLDDVGLPPPPASMNWRKARK